MKKNQRKTTNQFILDAITVHGNRYDYSLVEYKNGKTKVPIICREHGIFMQSPAKHTTQNRGCPFCAGNKRKTTEEFIKDAKKIHGDKYDYSLCNYINKNERVDLICSEHGKFSIIAHNHLWQKSGCPRCSLGQKSKPEILWLESLKIDGLEFQKRIKVGDKTYKVDGYDPKTRTIYELHGDFWHGNPVFYKPNHINPTNGKSFGDLYRATKNRESELISAGYKYVYEWESNIVTQLLVRKNYLTCLESWRRNCLHRFSYYKLWEYADGEDCYIDPATFIRP